MPNYQDILLYENPKKKRRKRRRNVAGVGALKMPRAVGQFMPGVDLMDIASATGGLAAATMIPNYFIKDTGTNLQKASAVGVALAAAIGASMVARQVGGASGQKAALMGGIAGTGAMALGLWTRYAIGGASATPRRRINETNLVSTPSSRGDETVSVIEP